MGDGENAEEDELQQKPVRRGRSSGGREDLTSAFGTSKTNGKGKGKIGSGTLKAGQDQSTPKKRGRHAASRVDEKAEEAVVEKASPKRRGRLSFRRVEAYDKGAEAVKESKSLRRGRSSNTEAELRGIAESEGQLSDVRKKPGRRPAAEKEAQTAVEEADEDPIAPPKRRRPAQRIKVKPPLNELVDDNSTRQKKRKRRSGAEILEAETLALTATEDYAKGRTPLPVAEPEAPSNGDQERGRKHTRRSDVQPTASLPADHQERGPTRTYRSIAELQELTMAGPSKQSKLSLQRDQRVEVEAASSKRVSNRSGLKKGVKPAIEKRTKSMITRSIASAAPEPEQTRKKISQQQSQDDAKLRKQKDVESECSYFLFTIFMF